MSRAKFSGEGVIGWRDATYTNGIFDKTEAIFKGSQVFGEHVDLPINS
jgi:hypothetical protein